MAEGDRQDEVLSVKKSIENYIEHLKEALDTSGYKLTEKEKTKVEEECEKCLKWMESTSEMNPEEWIEQMQHLHRICGPYCAKLFGPSEVLPTCRLEAYKDDEDHSGAGGSGFSDQGTPGSFLS